MAGQAVFNDLCFCAAMPTRACVYVHLCVRARLYVSDSDVSFVNRPLDWSFHEAKIRFQPDLELPPEAPLFCFLPRLTW